MFGIAPSELMIVALAAIIFIGPKDLPRAMRLAGRWIGKGRAITRQLRVAADDLLREAELREAGSQQTAEILKASIETPDLIS